MAKWILLLPAITRKCILGYCSFYHQIQSKSGEIIVRKPNVANTAAYEEALSIIPSDSSFRLEYVTDAYGGLFLEARGINLEAEIANIDRRYNTNFIESAPLNKLKLETLKPHSCLTKEKFAFGLVIFSHNPLDIYQYTTLAKQAMAEILPNFDQSIKTPATTTTKVETRTIGTSGNNPYTLK